MALATVIEPMGCNLTIGTYTFCAKSLAAPGLTVGDAIDTTTLCNEEYVTKQAPVLKEVPDFTYTANYDPSDFDEIDALVGVNSTCVLTVSTPQLSGTLTFLGYLAEWAPSETGRGEGWECTGTIVVTNTSVSGNVETGPVWA